jgi:Flavodoxin-like fold
MSKSRLRRLDPVLREPDVPDWGNPDNVYSSGLIREMERIERNQATVIVFPVGWWSMPAMLKAGSIGFGTMARPTADETTRTKRLVAVRFTPKSGHSSAH